MRITVLGIDAAFSNMGFCMANLDTDALDIQVDRLHLAKTVAGAHKKEVRKSSDDLRRATELYKELQAMCSTVSKEGRMPVIGFCEVPHGSQSARSSWGLGIATGVLAASPVRLIQLTALEVKMATVGKKDASKDEMIQWAYNRYPKANWLRWKGELTAANEHLADAVAAVYAGVRTSEFSIIKEALRIANASITPTATPRNRIRS